MNEPVPVNRLREALHRVDISELDEVADEIGREAAQSALARIAPPVDTSKAEAEAQRQRDLDAALADVVEIVNRHRARLGRRVCSSSDGRVIRELHTTLRSMAGVEAGGDPSFQ